MVKRTCTKCHVDKELTDFSPAKEGKYGVNSVCKLCIAAIVRLRRSKMERAYLNNIQWRSRIKSQFGITDVDYWNMFEAQKGVCLICGKPETGTSGKKRTPRKLMIDHDHETGKVRGLLCHHCNSGLGLFMDNPEILQAAKDYLEKFDG